VNEAPKAATAPAEHYKSKTLAAWLALAGGAVGLHRLYLRGLGDVWAWLHLLPTSAGYLGVLRLRDIGVDDRLSWALMPLLGLMLAQGMAFAIAYGLTPDERWDAKHNPGSPVQATRWGPIFAVVLALLLGATALMSTIAFSIQKVFEIQLEDERAQQPLRPQSQGSSDRSMR
jgi:hypothetical protein